MIAQAVPLPRPFLVGPAQAERKVGLAGFQNFLKWTLQQAAAVEPVVVIAEAVDSVFAGQVGLSLPRLWQSQVVEAQIGRQVRLVVPPKLRLAAGDVRPLGEAAYPPPIVLRDRVVLGKVKRDQSYGVARHVRRSRPTAGVSPAADTPRPAPSGSRVPGSRRVPGSCPRPTRSRH